MHGTADFTFPSGQNDRLQSALKLQSFEIELTKRYLPKFYLHPDEKTAPCSIEHFLTHAELFYGSLNVLKRNNEANDEWVQKVCSIVGDSQKMEICKKEAIIKFYTRYSDCALEVMKVYYDLIAKGRTHEHSIRRAMKATTEYTRNNNESLISSVNRNNISESKTLMSSPSQSTELQMSKIAISPEASFSETTLLRETSSRLSTLEKEELDLLCKIVPQPFDRLRYHKGFNLRLASRVHQIHQLQDLGEAPIYAHVRFYQSYIEIVYITHFPYNWPYRVFGRYVGAHDCDFEHVTVRVSCSQLRGIRSNLLRIEDLDASKCELMAVRYASHGALDGYWLFGSKIPTDTIEPNRAIVFVARGSHGNYNAPNAVYKRIWGLANDHTGPKAEDCLWSPREIVLLYPTDHPLFCRKWSAYEGKCDREGIDAPLRQGWFYGEPNNSNTVFRRIFVSFLNCQWLDIKTVVDHSDRHQPEQWSQLI